MMRGCITLKKKARSFGSQNMIQLKANDLTRASNSCTSVREGVTILLRVVVTLSLSKIN